MQPHPRMQKEVRGCSQPEIIKRRVVQGVHKDSLQCLLYKDFRPVVEERCLTGCSGRLCLLLDSVIVALFVAFSFERTLFRTMRDRVW